MKKRAYALEKRVFIVIIYPLICVDESKYSNIEFLQNYIYYQRLYIYISQCQQLN